MGTVLYSERFQKVRAQSVVVGIVRQTVTRCLQCLYMPS